MEGWRRRAALCDFAKKFSQQPTEEELTSTAEEEDGMTYKKYPLKSRRRRRRGLVKRHPAAAEGKWNVLRWRLPIFRNKYQVPQVFIPFSAPAKWKSSA